MGAQGSELQNDPTPVGTPPHRTVASVCQAMRISKGVIRNAERDKLHAVNAEECRVLQGRWLSDECLNAAMTFLSSRAKL